MLHILYPLEPRGHISRTSGSNQSAGYAPGTTNPHLCHDLSIHGEKFATSFITLQILLLSELEIVFSQLAKTGQRATSGTYRHFRGSGNVHSQWKVAGIAPASPPL